LLRLSWLLTHRREYLRWLHADACRRIAAAAARRPAAP